MSTADFPVYRLPRFVAHEQLTKYAGKYFVPMLLSAGCEMFRTTYTVHVFCSQPLSTESSLDVYLEDFATHAQRDAGRQATPWKRAREEA